MRSLAKPLYRTAAVLFLLFAAGHTAGFLTFRPKTTEAIAVLDNMKQVHFAFGSTDVTWLGLYQGFGLFVSAYLLFSAMLAWRLGNAAPGEIVIARTLAWSLFVVQLANIVLCLTFFGPVQALFAVACAASIGAAALRTEVQPASAI